ncbi:YggT family protein [Methylocystis sp. 9N]|uniref:YggT family protein n=1 Tax=Methylocystis borbori TaxID=3118750 RepID=A0ABU7XJY6_9HYPH
MSYAVVKLILTIIDIYWWILLATVVMSWLIAFDVVNMRSNAAYSIWKWLNAVTEPVLAPIRSVLPSVGGLDISPLILLLIMQFLRDLIASAAGGLAYG